MEQDSTADARLKIMRLLQSLYVEVLGTVPNADGTAISTKQRDEDEDFANELALETLETLGMEVTSVDSDGSFMVVLRPEFD